MINKSSIRKKNKGKFVECVRLRKEGLSYGEIRKIVPVAKSTLQNWLTFAGLTLTKEHLEIQLKKRVEKIRAATEAAKFTRAKKFDEELESFLQRYKTFINDSFFVAGLMLYQAEGTKKNECRFSNSDYRLVQLFLNFLEKYFFLSRTEEVKYRLFVHESRKEDLGRIKNFWAMKLSVPVGYIDLTWKKNVVSKRRTNSNYVGQLQVIVRGIPSLTRKILALSVIICMKYCQFPKRTGNV